MRAKQAKEEARNRRNRAITSVPAAKQPKRKPKREASASAVIKIEQDELTTDLPLFPGFYDHEQDAEDQGEYVVGTDSLSLKGQVWPGMGKMDLANDEMKRTRNQRKPKSVIDKMKKASEGIVPTQVVMTPDFKVERVKDVYDDSSSPIPGQEESTPPRKASKSKRRKAMPLGEISSNIPKQRRTNTRASKPQTGKMAETKADFDHQESSVISSSLGPFRHGHDVFRDDDGHSDPFGIPSLSSSRDDRRFDLRDRPGARSLNTVPRVNLVSPTPHARDLPSRQFGLRDGNSSLRPETFPPGSFSHIEASYAIKDATIYNASSRLPFTPPAPSQFHGVGQDHFRLSSNSAFQMKQEDYSGSVSGNSTQGTHENPFLGISGGNPLFTQDRLFLSSYNQGTPNTSLSSLAFSPINRQREHSHGARDVKQQTHLCEVLDGSDLRDGKDSGLDGPWNLDPSNHDLDFPDGLVAEDPQI